MTGRGPFPAHPARTAWAALAAALAFTLVAIPVARRPTAPAVLAGPDHAWLRLMLAHRSVPLDAAARAFSLVFAGPVYVVICLTAIVVLFAAKRYLAAAYVTAVILVATRVGGVLKIVVGRPRPPVPDRLFPVPEAAFPSGHSVDAAALLVALAVVVTAARPARWHIATVAAVVVTAAVMASRTYAGVHWLSDTVGGALLGAAWAFALWSAAGWWARRRGWPVRPESDVDAGRGRS
ncbi:MAG TPA: phosphatase PAP2 family protein [Streptosporangiaceae bacterium]